MLDKKLEELKEENKKLEEQVGAYNLAHLGDDNLPSTLLKPEIVKELMPLVCAFGFLRVYAIENDLDTDHSVFKVTRTLMNIVKLYKPYYKDILAKAFDIFDEITKEEAVVIDTVAFANSLLVFHSQMKSKKFTPSKKKIELFWLDYKKSIKTGDREKDKEINERYANSRLLASEFFKRISDDY